jgi:hypothetical protein
MSADLDFAIKQDIRNNPVVRDADARQRSQFRRTLAMAALIVAMLLFAVWQHFEVVHSGYELQRMRKELATESSTNRQLRLEIEMRRAPQVIEGRARTELKLVAPDAKETIVIERRPASTPDGSVAAPWR